MMAAKEGDEGLVADLVKTGADVNRQTNAGWTALHIAVASLEPHVVRTLIKAGTNVSAKTRKGETPMTVLLRLDPKGQEQSAGLIAAHLYKNDNVVLEDVSDSDLKNFYWNVALMLERLNLYETGLNGEGDVSCELVGDCRQLTTEEATIYVLNNHFRFRPALDKFYRDKVGGNARSMFERDYLVYAHLRKALMQ